MEEYRPSLDVLFGGLITFIVALFGVAAERRWSHHLRKKERLDRLSALAFSTQVKIAAGHAWSRSLKRSIDECFDDATAGPAVDLDPGVKVKPLVGAKAPNEVFTAEELSLLLETGDQGLVENLLGFQWRVGTVGALVEEFNVARRQYSSFVLENSLGGDFVDEHTGIVSLPGPTRHALDAQIAALNSMVGEFYTELPELMGQSKKLMFRVETALNSIDGLVIRRVGFHE
jgi:hypothetical protein